VNDSPPNVTEVFELRVDSSISKVIVNFLLSEGIEFSQSSILIDLLSNGLAPIHMFLPKVASTAVTEM
jgi:hypothetical protein